MKTLAMALLMSASAPLAQAQAQAQAEATPAGLWKTVDDETKEERSYVRIFEAGGTMMGKIEKLLDPARQEARCVKCSDSRKDQPVLGMTILEGVRKSAAEAHWEGGTILDPNNGKTYKLRLTPKEGGKLLEVRGFIGPFYRNQTWTRIE